MYQHLKPLSQVEQTTTQAKAQIIIMPNQGRTL